MGHSTPYTVYTIYTIKTMIKNVLISDLKEAV